MRTVTLSPEAVALWRHPAPRAGVLFRGSGPPPGRLFGAVGASFLTPKRDPCYAAGLFWSIAKARRTACRTKPLIVLIQKAMHADSAPVSLPQGTTD